MVRALCVVLVLGACTPAQAPKARTAGKWMSIGGVGGLIGTAFAARTTGDSTAYFIDVFSLMSVIGIATFAAGDLSTPASIKETIPERNTRWARILTERAFGAARDGKCPRVRRLETRVRFYDRDVHDFMFMRDPAIQKCMNPEPDPPQVPDAPTDAPAEATE
jgi:hypothetical protein